MGSIFSGQDLTTGRSKSWDGWQDLQPRYLLSKSSPSRWPDTEVMVMSQSRPSTRHLNS